MTGIGGQGIQLVAKLLAEAAMSEGKQVMMFGLFMGMVRGGSSESTVVVADEEIVSPPIVPDVWGVLAMHPEGLPKIAGKVRAGGVLLVNANLVTAPPAWEGVRTVAVPATEIAKQLGQPLGASMVALGGFVAASAVVGVEAVYEALPAVLPPHRRQHVEANRRCIEAGVVYVGAAAR